VFAFFAAATNLQSITPEFLHFRILTPLPIRMQPGTVIVYRLRLFGVPFQWHTHIDTFTPPERFTDIQLRGPYRHWQHLHEFFEVAGGTEVVDRVEYALYGGIFGVVAHTLLVRHTLARIFAYRRERLQALFAPAGRAVPGQTGGVMPHTP
jgi:ligand-binding SRPBCC domain-containing protein